MKEVFKKIMEHKILKWGFVGVVGVFGVLILGFCLSNKSAKVDTTYLISKLEKSSELTTAKLTYTGFSEYKDKGIKILNRSDFLMVYTATARFGIDLKEVKIDSNDATKTINIIIPKAEIIEVKVEPKSIKYYDEDFSLFNFNSKDDANEAQDLAEKAAKKDINKMGVLEMADAQSETLIKGLLQDVIPEGYKIKTKIVD